MKYKILITTLLLAVSSFGQAPIPLTIDSRAPTAPAIDPYQASRTAYRVTFMDGTNLVSLTGLTGWMSWSTNSYASTVSTAIVAVVSGSTGIVDFTFSASALNYTPGRYLYEVGLRGGNGITVYRQGILTLRGSPYANGVPPAAWTTNAVNWGSINWIGLPSTMAGYGIVDGVDLTDLLGVSNQVVTAQADIDTHEALTGTDVHGLGTASTHAYGDFATAAQGALAATALQSEADTNAIARLNTHTNLSAMAAHSGLGTAATNAATAFATSAQGATADTAGANATAALAGVLTVSNRVDDLETSTNALNSRAGNLEAATNSMSTRITSGEEATNALQTQVTALQGATGTLNTATNTLQTQITALKSATNTLSGNVSDLSDATNSLNSEISNLKSSTNALNTRAGALESATNALNTRMGTSETDVTALKGATNALNTRMSAAETSTNYLSSQVTSLKTATNNLQSQVTAANAATNALQIQATALHGATNSLNTSVAALKTSTNNLNTRVIEVESWGDHALVGYLTSATNLFNSLYSADRSKLGANLSGLTQGTYTGSLTTVSYTGVTALAQGKTYAWGFTKQNAFGTSTLSIATFSLAKTASGAISNYFVFKGTDTNLVLKLDGDGSSKSDVSSLYVKQITNGNISAAGDIDIGGVMYMDGALMVNPTDHIAATGTNVHGLGTMALETASDYAKSNLLGTAAFTPATNYATKAQGDKADSALQSETDPIATNMIIAASNHFEATKVSTNDTIYTDTVAKAASAVQTESDPIWTGVSNAVVYTNDSRLTDSRNPLAHNQDWSTITNVPATDHAALTNFNGAADVQHLTAAEKAIATNPPSTNVLASTNWVVAQGYGQGTITGGTVVTGEVAGVTTNDGVLNFTVPSGGGAGTITGAVSSSGSISVANPGGPQFDLNINTNNSLTMANGYTQSVDSAIVRGKLFMTNSASTNIPAEVFPMIDAPHDGTYNARYNGGWTNIGLANILTNPPQIIKYTGNTTTTAGKVYQWSTSVWIAAVCTNEAQCNRMIGVAIGTNSTSSGILLMGEARVTNNTLSPGGGIYIGTTAGEWTQTVPTNSGYTIRFIGYAVETNRIYVRPDGVWGGIP